MSLMKFIINKVFMGSSELTHWNLKWFGLGIPIPDQKYC